MKVNSMRLLIIIFLSFVTGFAKASEDYSLINHSLAIRFLQAQAHPGLYPGLVEVLSPCSTDDRGAQCYVRMASVSQAALNEFSHVPSYSSTGDPLSLRYILSRPQEFPFYHSILNLLTRELSNSTCELVSRYELICGSIDINLRAHSLHLAGVPLLGAAAFPLSKLPDLGDIK